MRTRRLAALLVLAGCAAGAEPAHLHLAQDGTLANGDVVDDQGCYEDLVQVELGAGPATVRAHSDVMPLMLQVTAPDGQEWNAGGGPGEDATVELTAKAAGTYRVCIRAGGEGNEGAYRFMVDGAAPPERAGAVNGDADHDRLLLDGGRRLAGAVEMGPVTIATALGAITLPGADLVEISRGRAGLTCGVLRDGSHVEGWLSGEPARVHVGAATLSVPLADVVALVRRGASAAADPPAAWVVGGGTRLRARWTAERLTVRTALGGLSVPTHLVTAVKPPSADAPLGRVDLVDGSVLRGGPEMLPLTVDGLAALPPGIEVAGTVAAAAADKPFVVALRSGDELVCKLGAFALESPYGVVDVAAGQAVTLEADRDEPGVLSVTLAGGERMVGRPRAPLPLAGAWGETAVPPELVLRAGAR